MALILTILRENNWFETTFFANAVIYQQGSMLPC